MKQTLTKFIASVADYNYDQNSEFWIQYRYRPHGDDLKKLQINLRSFQKYFGIVFVIFRWNEFKDTSRALDSVSWLVASIAAITFQLEEYARILTVEQMGNLLD